MSYKINEAIKVYYRAVGAESGITDLTFVPTNPSGSDQSSVALTEVSGYDGLYAGSFTPDAYGIWWIRVKSTTNPENVYAESYEVGETKLSSDANETVTTTTTNGRVGLDVAVAPISLIDTNNTTTTPLGADGSFVGDWTNITTFAHLSLQIVADEDSATDGVEIQWSTDGVSTIDYDNFTIFADQGKVWTFGCQAPYYRIVYTNGSSAQSSFNMMTLLKTVSQKPSSHRISDQINNQDDAELVKAVLTGEDSNGNFQNVSVSSNGELLAILTTASSSVPVQVQYNKAFSAINANEWQDVASYIVPTGYKYSVLSLRCNSETTGESARVFIELNGGTFNCATNTFTDGNSFTAPQFGSGLYAKVTTQIGSAVADTITITYTNEVGTTGRTCTIVIPKNSVVGTSIEGILQGDDIGVRDITNVTHSATGQAGAFKVDMYFNVFNLLLASSNVMYQAQSIAGNPIILPAGTEIVMAILAGTKTSYKRYLSLFGTLDVA